MVIGVIKSKDPGQAAKEIAQAKKALRRELSLEDKAPRKISPLAQKKLAQRKKKFRRYIYFAVFLLFAYIIWWGIKPFESSMEYGICKVFIELQVPYPYTIHYSEVVNVPTSNSIRVWFSHYDSFGDYRLENVQCFFGPNEVYGMGLTRITRDNREIEPQVVQSFNNALPAIFAYPPSLVYPTPLPNDLRQLQFDFERYRKQIF